jgi:uncharacterized membrane protein HdeD (DUF308 family)
MSNIVRKFIKSSLFSSIGLAILGILLFLESELTIVTISYVIGAVLVAVGAIAFINYINDIHKNTKNELNIVYGIGMAILGIIVISNPKGVASIIPFILGVIIVLNSSAKLEYSIELKKDNNKLWVSTMILSVVALLCGILLIFNPFEGATFITKIVGVIIFIYALIDIVSTLRLRKTIKTVQKALEDNKIKEAEVIEDRTSDKKKKKKDDEEDIEL